MTTNLRDTPYICLEQGARGISERAIRMAREGEAMEMIREYSMLRIYLDTIIAKSKLKDKEVASLYPDHS